jgi:hypothetical protein
MKVSPRYCLGMLSGPPACGKTNFMASCPGALILNVDQSSMPTERAEDLKATVWPAINEMGQATDAEGNPFLLTWKALAAEVEKVKQSAISGGVRPDFVVLDTMATAMDLAAEHIVEESKKSNWKDLHGPSAWDDLYRMILGLGVSLKRVGVGFWYVCHITNSVIQLGENQYKERPSLTITDNFWSRIHPRLELSLVMRSDWEISDLVQKRPDGTERRVPGKGPKIRTSILTISDERYAGITKGRVDFQDLVIPRVGGWDAFEKSYTTHPGESQP